MFLPEFVFLNTIFVEKYKFFINNTTIFFINNTQGLARTGRPSGFLKKSY
jgi:hypothetical protein